MRCLSSKARAKCRSITNCSLSINLIVKIMDKLTKIFSDAFNKNRWWNESEFCNRKTHPLRFKYRRYKRGKNRCNICGAKIGKIECIRERARERLIDNIYNQSSILQLLQKRGAINATSNAKGNK